MSSSTVDLFVGDDPTLLADALRARVDELVERRSTEGSWRTW